MRCVLLLTLLVPLAAGCGSKQVGLDASEQALKDAGSSRIEMTMVGEEPTFSARGAFDYAHDSGELVITSEGMEIPGGEMHGVFIGPTAYMGFRLLDKMRWQKESDYEPSGTERFLPGPGGTRPDRLLDLLIKSSTKVETLDTEEIRGVRARHYKAHLDERTLGEDASYVPKDVVIDAWIDENGLLRRLRMPDTEDESIVVELFDFGVEVNAEAPSASEIVTEEELNELMAKECKRMSRAQRRNSIFCGGLISGRGVVSGESGHSGESEVAPTETLPVEER